MIHGSELLANKDARAVEMSTEKQAAIFRIEQDYESSQSEETDDELSN